MRTGSTVTSRHQFTIRSSGAPQSRHAQIGFCMAFSGMKMNNGARPGTGDAPLGYRFFFVDSLKMTSAAAWMTAMRILPTHLLGMRDTTLLRSGGPAEG